MAEKSNEELLIEFMIATLARTGNWDVAGDDARFYEARAAVLARMCGPGDVVVPKEPTHDMLSAWTFTKDYGEHKTLMRAAYANLLAARPRTRRQR